VPPHYNNYDRSEAIAHKRAQVLGVQDIEDAPAVQPHAPPKRTTPRRVLLDEPKYPTAASLLTEVNNTGIVTGKTIQESDMEQLLEMMVLEGRLEKLSGTNYRLAVKATDVDEGMNGFVDAPCGTCPVFDLCGDSGEITARTCEYFTLWLETA
jgi:DNA-directed RNA polymerase III subunit RPC6